MTLHRSRKKARTRGRRRRNRREEGAVMLVVLLILMIATAASASSMGVIQSELRATGDERIAVQAHYVAESAMMTTLTWLDVLGPSGQFLEIWNKWAVAPPKMAKTYGELEFTSTLDGRTIMGRAGRMTMNQQRLLVLDKTQEELAPIQAGGHNVDPSQAEIGSFGPNQAYSQVDDGYVVDISDCQAAGAAATPGAPVGGGPGSMKVLRLSCVMTARARLALAGETGDPEDLDDAKQRTRDWTVQTETYRQLAFGRSHDARATVLLPEMLVAAE